MVVGWFSVSLRRDEKLKITSSAIPTILPTASVPFTSETLLLALSNYRR